MQTKQELEQIIADAPEGAEDWTHFCEDSAYWKIVDEKYFIWAGWADNPFWFETPITSFTRSRADIRTIVDLMNEVEAKDKQIAELEKHLKPDLFWDANDTDISHDSIEELMNFKFEDGAKVGHEVEIQRAALLPNETYVFTKIDDEDYSCEYKLKEQGE